ncbi:uncharacterized protein [Macrobrachium rosenbergii]|uniref:uncharacterized protein n=1 Tax=Macrobrachium rosenbergii TaxID=79674 RepID=UPI0034D66161
MAAEEPRSPKPLGFYVRDTISGRMMLVNTGAVCSVFPPSREDRKCPPDPAAFLTAANGSLILTYGTRLLSISILGWRYTWNFIIADVRTPLLGADFFAHFGLAVDVGRKRLLDTDSCQSLHLALGTSVPTICSVTPHQYAQLLKEFPDVFKPELHQVPGAPAKHRIYHRIKMKGPPAHTKFRRWSGWAYARRPPAREPLPSTWSPKEHLRHVRAVPQRLQNGLVVRFDKCTVGVEKTDFIGHEISPDGIHSLTSKIAAITRFPTPTSIKAVQEFLRMVNYYRRFIPGIAHTMAPLTEILKGRPKSLVWGPNQQQAFSLMKAALAKATALAHQNPNGPLQLTMDASNVTCGAVLEQIIAGGPQPIAFSSKKFNPAEARYSTFDRELCAVYQAVQHFKKNPVADALSRIELSAVQLRINYEDLGQEQTADPETPAYCTAITSLKWKDMALAPGRPKLLCDISTCQPRPLVPASHRRLVFDIIHRLSHPSGRTMAKLLTEKFVWHRMRKEARRWVR